MGIDTEWVDEDHEVLAQRPVPQGHLSGLVGSVWPSQVSTACLRSIDPNGDTVCNQSQLPVLRQALHDDARDSADPAIRAPLQEVLQLIDGAVGRVHTYIKFVGD